MKKIAVVLSIVLISVVYISASAEAKDPMISIEALKLKQSMKHGLSGFMLIINDGKGNDRLTGVSLKEYPSARGELHNFIGGKMVKIDEIWTPAGEITVLKRGSFHVMFFDLPEPVKDELTVLLVFEKSGRLDVKARVKRMKMNSDHHHKMGH